MFRKNLSVVIPNYNGKDVLNKCLPSVIEALDRNCDDYEIIIVDDGSDDGSPNFIKRNYPQAKIYENNRRTGVEFSCNFGFSKAEHDLVLIIPNDVRLEKDFCKYIFAPFLDEDVFALTPKILDWEGCTLTFGKARGVFRKGMLGVNLIPGVCETTPTLFASGTASVFNREKYLELGGFDNLFGSAHMEDFDLSYRAWKRGWRIIYEPRCIAYHRGSATRSKLFSDDRLAYLRFRNQWLFMWKNLTDPVLTAKHLLWLVPRLIFALLKGNRVMVTSFVGAVRELKQVLKKHRYERLHSRVSDREILRRLSS